MKTLGAVSCRVRLHHLESSLDARMFFQPLDGIVIVEELSVAKVLMHCMVASLAEHRGSAHHHVILEMTIRRGDLSRVQMMSSCRNTLVAQCTQFSHVDSR